MGRISHTEYQLKGKNNIDELIKKEQKEKQELFISGMTKLEKFLSDLKEKEAENPPLLSKDLEIITLEAFTEEDLKKIEEQLKQLQLEKRLKGNDKFIKNGKKYVQLLVKKNI